MECIFLKKCSRLKRLSSPPPPQSVAWEVDTQGFAVQLPPMPETRSSHMCGAVPSPDGDGSTDVVVAGGFVSGTPGGSSAVYNNVAGAWRPGRTNERCAFK